MRACALWALSQHCSMPDAYHLPRGFELAMGIDWSAACFGALKRSSSSRKDVITASCGVVSAAQCIVFLISTFFFICHRRYMRTVSNPEKGYWKHYGPFCLFTALGSFSSAFAWAFYLKSLNYALDASQAAHSNDAHSSSFSFRSQSLSFAVLFQALCKRDPLLHASVHLFT